MQIALSPQPVVSLIAGILILFVPRLLNYIVAIYLIKEIPVKNSKIFRNQARKIWLHPTVAARRSDSYFVCDISGAWLHIIGAKRRNIESTARNTALIFFQHKGE
jgi:hypothetical protein